MPNYLDKHVIVIGTGPMAIAHVDVLKAMGVDITVVGRGVVSADSFESKTGIKPYVNGIERYLDTHSLKDDDCIIIAVGTEMLMPILLLFINRPFRRILIEKPAALSIKELVDHKQQLKSIQDKVFIAYNRRHYASVSDAQKIIIEDGGLQSLHFEFTEWAHKITPLQKAVGVKENWFFANSTHVIDLAFFIAGLPAQWTSFTKQGSISWHSITGFAGAGITERGALFSYCANWESAGRWSIELLTNERRLFLRPLEELWQQRRGQLDIVKIDRSELFDANYKPGLFKQAEEFLNDSPGRLQSLSNHIILSESVYQQILNPSGNGA
jgi:predicted dehydrogenase